MLGKNGAVRSITPGNKVVRMRECNEHEQVLLLLCFLKSVNRPQLRPCATSQKCFSFFANIHGTRLSKSVLNT